MPQLKMKGWIMQRQWRQVWWRIVIKQTELTLTCQFDTRREHFHSGGRSLFYLICDAATDMHAAKAYVHSGIS